MKTDEFEWLYLQSLDGQISDRQRSQLSEMLSGNHLYQKEADQFTTLRTLVMQREESSFSPFFAERITHHLKNLKSEIDYQIFSFFKKYQLAALGIVVALVVFNLLQSEQLSIASFFGFEDTTSPLDTSDFFTAISH